MRTPQASPRLPTSHWASPQHQYSKQPQQLAPSSRAQVQCIIAAAAESVPPAVQSAAAARRSPRLGSSSMLVPLPEALQSVCGSKSVPTLRAKLPSHSPWLRPSPGGSTDSKQPQPARCRLYMMRQVHASARQWQRQPPLPAHVASLLQPGPRAAARHALLPATAQSTQHSVLNALRANWQWVHIPHLACISTVHTCPAMLH